MKRMPGVLDEKNEKNARFNYLEKNARCTIIFLFKKG